MCFCLLLLKLRELLITWDGWARRPAAFNALVGTRKRARVTPAPSDFKSWQKYTMRINVLYGFST